MSVEQTELSVLIKQYATDLRRNASGGDDYPYEYAKATADYLEELIKRAKGNCTCAQAGFPDSCDNCDGVAPRSWTPDRDAIYRAIENNVRSVPDENFIDRRWMVGINDAIDAILALADTSTHQSAPERNPPHNSGERLPSSDAAVPGADTCKGK